VRILDLHVKNITPHDAAREVAEYDPQVVAITVKTLGWPACIEIAEMVRATVPRAVIVIGGPHLGIYPRESLSWPCFDVAVVGDGEETFLELCERVRDGGIEPATISELDAHGGNDRPPSRRRARRGPAARAAEGHRSLPDAGVGSPPVADYHCLTLFKPFATMVTTRGCPWHCGYCSQVYSEKLRFRSPELVVDEMEHLEKTYGVKEIVFFDETFTIGKKRMRTFADESPAPRLKVKFNIRARVDTVDREVVRLLKRAGSARSTWASKAGTDRVLKIMNKQITRAQTEQAFRICREEGVDTRGYFMIGYYDATPQDIDETIRFASSLGLDWASFSVATALPATDLYTVARQRGYVEGDFLAPVHHRRRRHAAPARDGDLHGRGAPRLANEGLPPVLPAARSDQAEALEERGPRRAQGDARRRHGTQ
jgi:anaerobic magnesium-protoporphyrin IX monomethyl ester cyclase